MPLPFLPIDQQLLLFVNSAIHGWGSTICSGKSLSFVFLFFLIITCLLALLSSCSYNSNVYSLIHLLSTYSFLHLPLDFFHTEILAVGVQWIESWHPLVQIRPHWCPACGFLVLFYFTIRCTEFAPNSADGSPQPHLMRRHTICQSLAACCICYITRSGQRHGFIVHHIKWPCQIFSQSLLANWSCHFGIDYHSAGEVK